MFRVFGSPFTLVLHQHVTYLRLKQLPFKVYCTSLTTTLFYGLIYGSRNAFCCLTPTGRSRLQVWQLAESAELDEDLLAATRAHGQGGEVKYVTAEGKTLTDTQRILLSKRTHPQLHLAAWATVLYSCWWLAKTGGLYRWVLGEDLDTVEGYVRYFMFGAVPGFSLARTMSPKFREAMSRIVMVTGVSKETAPFMDEHFHRMCKSLEHHFSNQQLELERAGRAPHSLFLLGTPHPTLADVTLGAAFSSSFLTDDPPAAFIAERYPHLVEYVERVTSWKGGVFVGDKAAPKGDDESEAAGAKEKEEDREPTGDYPDIVPESLAGFFAVLTEVFPFMMSQCASFNTYMSSDAVRTLKREALEAPWEGCHAYLLPQMTNIKSLMIIDSTVLSVQARAQDLEVAFLAAQEVMDDDLDDFGRAPALEAAEVRLAERKDLEAQARILLSQADVAAAEESNSKGDGGSAIVEAAADGTLTTDEGEVTRRPRGRMIISRPTDITDADEADFYRVFTKQGIRRFGSVSISPSSIVRRSSAEDGLAAGGLTVYDHLKVLRGMLSKMRSPQYTLTSVFHGRRMYVAAIPEYEVARLRAKRAMDVRAPAAKRPED